MYPEKQISNQSVNTMNNANDNEESTSKINRSQKQTEVARQRAAKFSKVFKVKTKFVVERRD
jgi:hypothetical protein